jgi:hypothetical protein
MCPFHQELLGDTELLWVTKLSYSEDESYTIVVGKRLGKNILSETDDIVQQYSDTLDVLMQQFRDQVDRDVAVFVYRTGKNSGF